MNAAQVNADITALLRARHTLLWITSREEMRVERACEDSAAIAKFETRRWDCDIGITRGDGSKVADAQDPSALCDFIRRDRARAVYVLRDMHKWLNDPVVQRKVKNLARELQTAPPNEARALIILTSSSEVPPELSSATIIEYPLPDRAEVARILDDVLAALPENIREAAAPNGTRERAIDSAVGLPAEGIANCYARSLVTNRTIDPALVMASKKQAIKANGITVYDPDPRGLDAIGGYDVLKTWAKQRALAFSKEARAYGLPSPKGALLVGPPGCLTGDTMINVNRKQRGGGHKSIRLDALFYRFNGRHEEGAKLGLYDGSKRWDLNHPTKAHCYLDDEKYIGWNEIEGVVFSGVKLVYQLTTDHSAQIKATPDHEFLTTKGYVRLDQLRPGDELLAHQNGVLLDDNSTGRNRNKAIRQINNVGNHPFARRRTVNGLDYSSYPLHRLVVEANMNGFRLEEYLWVLHGDTSGLEFLAEDVEVHHKDEDRDNNMLSNLEPMSKADHARHHMTERGVLGRWRYAPRVQKVTKITRVGKMPTYDIQMKTPHHNFVANGLVVHNCGKSLTAKAFGVAFGMPVLRLDLGGTKSKYVGESEQNIRGALKVAEAMAPCVLWLDEIEKALAGASGPQGDGGVSADALGTILSWMQEKTAAVFVVATANDVRALPPELLRKGRFDEMFFIDLPTTAERVEIVKAALRQYNRASEGIDVEALAVMTDGFTGAEIAAIVPDALFTAFADGERALSTADLKLAAGTVVPLSKTASEKLLALREWAKGRARPASTPESAASGTTRSLDL